MVPASDNSERLKTAVDSSYQDPTGSGHVSTALATGWCHFAKAIGTQI